MDFFLGIGLGFAISLLFSFGPAFFVLIQTSTHYGFKFAKPFPFGTNFSDILTVNLLLTIFSGIDMSAVLHNRYVVYVGTIAMVVFALYFFTRKDYSKVSQQEFLEFRSGEKPHWFFVWGRGFLINFLNPIAWLYWISIITFASGLQGTNTNSLYLFFAGVLLTTCSLDVLKCFLASKLQKIITPKVLHLLNIIIGCILLGFGAYLIISFQLHLASPEFKLPNTELHG